MQKCLGCNYYTDKCKNDNSKNYNKYERLIRSCVPELIDKSKANMIISHKPKDDSI